MKTHIIKGAALAAIVLIAAPATAGDNSIANSPIGNDNGNQVIGSGWIDDRDYTLTAIGQQNNIDTLRTGGAGDIGIAIDNSGDQIIDVSPDLDLTSIAGAHSGDVSSVNDNASTASGNATNVSYASNYRQSASTAIAPTMIAACGSSMTGAASGRSFSAALGIPFGLQTCQIIQLSGALIGMGASAAGCELLASDRRVRDALDRAGASCNTLTETE